jgi:hypothetical protein
MLPSSDDEEVPSSFPFQPPCAVWHSDGDDDGNEDYKGEVPRMLAPS